MRKLTFNPNYQNLTDRQRTVKGVLKAMGDMKLIDIQAACIVRGMDFDDMAEADVGGLETFLLNNWNNEQDRTLLEEYDIWVDQILAEKYERNDPVRQFRKFSIWDEEGEVKVNTRKLTKAKIPKKKRQKVQRNTKFNIISGTKKEYTHKLAQSLHDKFGDKYTNKEIMKKFSAQLVNKVSKKFPDANEKSVKIWAKRALDALSNNKK